MDVILSTERDDTLVLEAPFLIETSDDGSEPEPPVSRLPTELIMLIFRQCESDIRPLLTLTHICRRWRHIAVNDALLWSNTTIRIEFIPYERLDCFLSILGMQLDRTANLPLKVAWSADIGENVFIGTMQIIREKAPFSRWRKLAAYIPNGLNKRAPWSSLDAFTNLEILRVKYGTDNSFISVIDRTVTSRLRVLHLFRWPADKLEQSMSSFAKSFTYISTFVFDVMPHSVRSPILPHNIVHLRLKRAETHLFPHITAYEVQACVFIRAKEIELGNMTALIVTHDLNIESDCQVFLPALREFKLKILRMGPSAKIEAPALRTLAFTNINHGAGDTDPSLLSDTDKSLLGPGYLLSPKTSVTVDSHLPITALITILAKSPKVTHATLRFDNWANAQVALGELVGSKTETDPGSAENEVLCPRLSELRLDFNWKPAQLSASEEWLRDALKSRRGAGLAVPLSIYAGWKGEGTYALFKGS